MPAITTSNVLVGQATLYTAPANTAAPPDTLAQGATWASPWVYIGATEAGVSLEVGTTTSDIRVEEQATPVITTVTDKTIRILATLSEDTLANMKLAFGGGTLTTQNAATGVIGKQTLTLSNSLSQLAAGFEGVNAAGFWRRVYIPQVLSLATVTVAYRRAANNRSYALELHAVCDPSQVQIVDMTAAAL